jgi:Carbamoyl-phosphate synthase small chain, CPSase domain
MTAPPAPPALLVLEDGTTFLGTAYGAPGEAFGEAVFSTGMTGAAAVTHVNLNDAVVPDRASPTTSPGCAASPARAWTSAR